MLKFIILFVFCMFGMRSVAVKPAQQHENLSPYEYVNPFIGTGNEGNCFPGAQAPFGMISISPNNTFENYEEPFSRPGYKYSRKEINGFGLTHYSGVGCHAMQDLQFMFVSGSIDKTPVNDKYAYVSAFSHEEEKAHPGFYAVHLSDYQVEARFTVEKRSGIGEIVFGDNKDAHVVFAPTNNANGIGAGELHIDKDACRVTGWVSTGGFCWRDPKDRPYKVYFTASFDTEVTDFGVWKGKEKQEKQPHVGGNDIGAYISFGNIKGKIVKMKVAISYVSIANAALNLEREIPGWDFCEVYHRVKKTWEGYLNRMTVEGGTFAERQSFYTALYHNLLHPNVYNDVNGQYMGFDDRIHMVENGRTMYANFSLWDTYRTTAYLQAMIAPEIASDMVQSLLHNARQGGAYPNWSMNNIEYGVMNGYSTFPFIANMYAMGVRDFDLQGTKEMMKRVSVKHIPCRGYHGWQNVDEYMALGYVPIDKHGHGGSMTLEYSIDDFSIAQICKAAGDEEAYTYYAKRAQSFENLFDQKTRLLRPRKQDGSFVESFGESTETGFNEGNALQYFWSVPHNMGGFIELAGGKCEVEKRLDAFCSKINRGWAPDQPYYWLGNEPCFGSAYVYNYLEKPWKSQQMVRKITNCFDNTPDGLPGDDDAGAMSALYIFSTIGLYPYIPGVGGFVITGPLFEKVCITLSNGKRIELKAPNAGQDRPYIQCIKINDELHSSSWIDWRKLQSGARIDFMMSSEPDREWGIGENNVPPSFHW